MTDLPTVSLALDNQLCFKLYAASRAVTRAYKPMLDQLGLTYPQYVVMLVLWEWHHATPPQPTVKALGERLMLDSGTLTPLLKRMQSNGLLVRERSQEDERRVLVSLTPEGKKLKARAAAIPPCVAEATHCTLTELMELTHQLKALRNRLTDF